MKYFTSDGVTFFYTSLVMIWFWNYLKKIKDKKRKKTYHSARFSLEHLVLWEVHASVGFAVFYKHVQMDNAG